MKNEVTADMLQRLNEELATQSTAVPSKAAAITPSSSIDHQARLSGRQESPPETPYEVGKLMSALAVLSPDALRGNGKLYEPAVSAPTQNYWLIVNNNDSLIFYAIHGALICNRNFNNKASSIWLVFNLDVSLMSLDDDFA